MWRIHLSPSYVYYYCPTLFTKTGSIFYSSRFSHLQTLATQRLLNWCGQREWKCLHIVCLCWYVYFYVVKSGDFHCKQMSVQIHKNYLFIFFVVVASELYSQVLFHALVPKLQSQWCISVWIHWAPLLVFWLPLDFSSSSPPLLLLSFLAIFSILIPLFFSESIFFCSVFSCSKLIELFLPYLLLQSHLLILKAFFLPLFVFYLQFVFIFLFILFPLLLCSLFLILFLNKFILLSFYLFFLLLHNLLDFLLNLRRVVVTIKGQSKKNKTALHWHILTCRNFSPKLLYKYIKYHI